MIVIYVLTYGLAIAGTTSSIVGVDEHSYVKSLLVVVYVPPFEYTVSVIKLSVVYVPSVQMRISPS